MPRDRAAELFDVPDSLSPDDARSGSGVDASATKARCVIGAMSASASRRPSRVARVGGRARASMNDAARRVPNKSGSTSRRRGHQSTRTRTPATTTRRRRGVVRVLVVVVVARARGTSSIGASDDVRKSANRGGCWGGGFKYLKISERGARESSLSRRRRRSAGM